MPIDFSDLTGKTPYASELFGVYQPILGWRSNLNKQRVSDEGRRITREIIQDIANDLRTHPNVQFDPNTGFNDPSPLSPLVNEAISRSLQTFQGQHGRMPDAKEWEQVITHADFGSIGTVSGPVTPSRTGFHRLEALGITYASSAHLTAADLETAAWHKIEGTELFVARNMELGLGRVLSSQTAEVQTVRLLSKFAPAVLANIYSRANLDKWRLKLPYIDPLAEFAGSAADAILSPIGLLQLYREYFFEGRSFAGPAVGHVWLSPGSSLELYEVHTRKRIEEQRIEVGVETTRRSETTITEQDELSSAVSEQNGRNTNLGVTASAGINFGVVQSNTSANFALGQTQTTASQTARKHMRQQTDKLSTEIRKSVTTSFRTSVESDDTQSRRYVLNNTTDKLVNYELRRKMRRVGVQVQRLDAQLCWQLYIDEPGNALAIPQLVHVAKPSDLDSVPPPEAPPALESKETDMVYPFPYQSRNELVKTDNVTYGPSGEAPDPNWPGFFPDREILSRKRVHVLPPEPGYRVATVNLTSIDRINPEEDLPFAAVHFEIPQSESGPGDYFYIVLDQVNFENQPALQMNLKIGWSPTQAAKEAQDKAFADQQTQYTAEKSRAAYEAYVDAVRERVKLAGQVERRPEDDLREEERTVVYRRLIRKLTAAEAQDTPAQRHVVAELVQSFFDVDRMLYFVAPEWWQPRPEFVHQGVVAITPELAAAQNALRAGDIRDTLPQTPGANSNDSIDHLLPSNLVDWGGSGAGRDHYLVTEESAPAPMGASLGWVLQLDGDAHRNAFLNTPWVKAVVPIRRGRESAAIDWLKKAHVEGDDGLGERLQGQTQTVEQALRALAKAIADDEDEATTARAEDRLFEHGFDPLADGTRLEPFPVFDSWVEVMPTDQIIAVEYTPDV